MLKTEPESLFEVHKAERRARILAAARALIARHGVDGLTLRDLAAAASVSVPTVYNLIGGKTALLSALMGDTIARVAARFQSLARGGMVERALALCEAGWTEILTEPGYFRGLLHSFLVSTENTPLRREIDEANVQLMTGVLRLGRDAGELVDWSDPEMLARTMWAHYVVCMIGWAAGELTDDELPSCATYGLASLLLGLSRGDAQRKLEKIVRASQAKARRSTTQRKGARQ